MGNKTGISWADHTFNIWWGCEHAPMYPGSLLTSSECDHCYAQTFDHRLGGAHWGPDAPRRFFGDRYWEKPIAWNAAAEKAGVRARVFCSSMADWAERRDGDIGRRMDAARARLWALIRRTPWLDWLMLTKRAENLATMLPWLRPGSENYPSANFGEPWPNVWPGVTCGARSSLWRIPMLRAVPAVVRFVSCEPLLEPITAEDWDNELGGERCKDCGQRIRHWRTTGIEGRIACGCNDESGRGPDLSTAPLNGIDWLIVGDESGPGRRPADIEWVRTARDAAERHGTGFHFKQWNGPSSTAVHGQRAELQNDKQGKIHLPILDGMQHAAFPKGQP